MSGPPRPTFFKTPAAFRRWLAKNHASAAELWVGFHKKSSGEPSITWPEAVEQALCFGWIDGVRKSVDERSYMNRFTPRRPTSNWSNINVRKALELIEQGLMQPAGLAAFEKRRPERTGRYSAEQEGIELGDEYEGELRRSPAAWEFFQAQPPWYRRTATWWVISAKREETRRRRLQKLIAEAEAERWIGPLSPPGRKPPRESG